MICFGKATLQLDRSPLVESWIPACRDKTRRAGDWTRVPCSVGQIAGENLAFVGSDKHIIVGGTLRHHWHLTLNFGHAAVRTTSSAGIGEFALRDDFCAEAARRSAKRVCEKFVSIMRAAD